MNTSPPELPKVIRLLNWGRNTTVRGPVVVGERTAAELEASQVNRGFEEVALDFEHNTVPGSGEFERTKEPREVAGYGRPVAIRGQGLFLKNVRWTPAGHRAAANYIDLSPAVELDDRNEVCFVHSAALTRNGAAEGIHLFFAEYSQPAIVKPVSTGLARAIRAARAEGRQ